MGRTTVDLVDLAEKIRQKLTPIYGLSNVLSAGLLLFDRLSSDEQKTIITEVNGIEPEDFPQQAAESARFFIKIFLALDPKEKAIALQFLYDDESRGVRDMLDAINPEIQNLKHIKKAKTG